MSVCLPGAASKNAGAELPEQESGGSSKRGEHETGGGVEMREVEGGCEKGSQLSFSAGTGATETGRTSGHREWAAPAFARLLPDNPSAPLLSSGPSFPRRSMAFPG